MTISTEKKPGVGVVVGRFQVHQLHDGHLALLDTANNHQRMLICVGVHPFLVTPTDPLDFPTRSKMLAERYPHATIVAVPDQPNDELWSKDLDKLIKTYYPLDSPILYSGRDSFKKSYSGNFPVYEIATIHLESGTSVREKISKEVRNTADFRRGVVYGAYNKWPVVSPTVDIVVYKRKDKTILLGQKPNEPGVWRLPGGFVDMSDYSLEDAARRELEEETGLIIEGKLHYICSMRVEDWRNGPKNTIMTSLFACEYSHGMAKAGDDLGTLEWIPLDKISSQFRLTKSHEELVYLFMGSHACLWGKPYVW